MVVGVERVDTSERGLEDLEATLRGGAHLLVFEVGDHRLPTDEVCGQFALARGDGARLDMELPSHQSGDVGGDRWGGGELPTCETVLDGRGRRLRGVRVDLPIGRRDDGQLERALQVGLFEAPVHSAGIGSLELGVEVDTFVGRVDEAVQALTGTREATQRRHRELVLALAQIEGETAAVVGVHGQLDAVKPSVDQLVGDQVEPAASSAAGEAHCGGGHEG